jgi:uncharacterized protein YbaR (Trm112 family)
MISPRELKLMCERGENLTAALRQQAGATANTDEIIEWSYDIQAGSYIQALQKSEYAAIKQAYTGGIASVLTSTLGDVFRKLDALGIAFHGFDLSWSRIAFARQWLRQERIPGISLCTASLLHMPYADDSIDIVYTSHSIEPNGGREEPILRELYRVTRRYLVLLEPGYEFASHKARRRMESHGYCRDLPGVARSLGFRIIEHELFSCIANPLNPTALTIIEKLAATPPLANPLVCPRFKTPLKEAGGMLFSPEALTVYPIIGGIPCLRLENGIIASRYLEFCDGTADPWVPLRGA